MQEKINKFLWLGVIFLLFVIALSFFFSKKEQLTCEKRLYYMDTYIYVKLYGEDTQKLDNALAEVESIYKKYHELTNRYSGYPGLHNVYYIANNDSKEEWLPLDERLYDLLLVAKEWYEKSNHLVDVRIGKVVDVWKEAEEKNVLPTQELLDDIQIEDLILEDGKIYNNHVSLDLGALAKGYASFKVKEYLEENHLDTYMINAGGMILLGEHYGKQAYKVGLEDPSRNDGSIFMKVKAKNTAIATSGGYERYYTIGEEKYSHIILPETRWPENHFGSVIVITEDPLKADILSTMLYLMKLEDALAYVNHLDDVEAIFYVSEEEQILSEGANQYLYE